jgi:RNA polymerase sigma factor for flagellar operon FliA
MGAVSGEYPRELAKVIGHAKRLAKVLASLESQDAHVWFLGRASELRGVVSLALGDWRSGVSNTEATRHAIDSYVVTLHQGAARRLRSGLALDCCDLEDIITAALPEESGEQTAHTEATVVTCASTVPARWVDSPAVLAWVREGLPMVDRCARAVARRVGEAHATLDDLRAFGREGLLDAARSFDDRRGVPFDRWAALRIRNTMIDGVRRWGPVPPRMRRRHQSLDGMGPPPDAASARSPAEGTGTNDGSDSAPLVPAIDPQDAPVGVGEGSQGLGATPEALLEKAETAALVREIVADLPNRERVLIERSYFQGLTPEQAAASIGVSRSWAHRVHARAIERLDRELRKRDRMAREGRTAWTSKRS